MKNLYRALLSLLVLFALLMLAACSGAPGCNPVSFGSTAPGSGSGSAGFGGGSGGGGTGGGGGGGNGTAVAYAYAINQAGTIDGYELTSANSFGPMSTSTYTAPQIGANSGGVGMVVAQKQYLYAGLGATDQLYGWTIGSNGALTAITNSPFTISALSGYINGVGQNNIITNPAGTLLFIADASASQIAVYSIGSGGILTLVGSFSCPPNFTPMNLATDGLGLYLYATDGTYLNHQGTAIAGFSIGTGANLGVLTPVSGSPFTGSTAGADFAMWQLQGEPTGQYMIGTTGSTAYYSGVIDDKHLYVFSIGNGTGNLTELGTVSTDYSPFSIAVQSNSGGNLVYSMSFTDTLSAFNPIEGFSITSTGSLAVDGSSPFSLSNGEGSWAQFDQSGAYLFMYASYTNASNQVVTTLAPLSVGSGGTLTQSATAYQLGSSGFWVVTDPN